MQPFDLSPGWRISSTDRQFVLERLSTPKKDSGKEPTFVTAGYHSKVQHAIAQWAEEVIRESEAHLPEAVRQVREDLERIAALIGARDFIIQV